MAGLGTRAENISIWTRELEPRFGSRPVSETTADEIYDYLEQRRSEGLAESTIKKEGHLLLTMANWAEGEEIVAPHRLHHVDWPKGKGHSGTFDDKQFPVVLRAIASDDRLAGSTLLHHDCFFTRSEVADLRWDHVNFTASEILVMSTKRRLVPILPRRTAAVLERLREANPMGQVFTVGARQIDRLLADACDQFGLKAANGEPVSFRMVTRTARERLRRIGTPEEVISRLTGRVGPFNRMPGEVKDADVRYWAHRYEGAFCREAIAGGAAC